MDGGSEPIIGPVAFREVYDSLTASFSNIRITLLDVTETADKAIGRSTLDLTHAGEFKNARATGKQVTVTGMTIIRYENGMVAEAWNEWDRLILALETGAVLAK